MIPFLGHGEEGRQRGVKLALIAGIKESLYDDETLAKYLIWRLWRDSPECEGLWVLSRSLLVVLTRRHLGMKGQHITNFYTPMHFLQISR